MQPIPLRVVRDLQDAVQAVGQSVVYTPAGADSDGVNVVARCRYATDLELANAIENYRLVVTFDARDFPTPPAKGDSVTVDGARRGVMWMREIRLSGQLVSYQCGVQG